MIIYGLPSIVVINHKSQSYVFCTVCVEVNEMQTKK